MRRILGMSLLSFSMVIAHDVVAYDPAYVDSPQSRAIPDPARADAPRRMSASGSSNESLEVREAYEQQAAAQQQAQMARMMEEDARRFAALQAAAGAGSGDARSSNRDLYDDRLTDPPVGGRNLGNEMMGAGMGGRGDAWSGSRNLQPSPARQIGTAMAQDAAGVLDTRIRQQTGTDRIVIVPSPSDDPPGY